MVTVKVSGELELLELRIDPEAVDPEDVELLQDMVQAAVNEALRSAQEVAASKLGAVTGGLGGMGLPGSGPHGPVQLPLFAPPVNRLITELARLPGIGQRTAQRLAFHMLRVSDEEALALADAIREVKETVGHCEVCFNLATEATCRICQDERREAGVICVVEEPSDVIPIERTNEFSGRYHVLGGALSPIDGVDPEDLHIGELLERGVHQRRPRGGGGHERHDDRRGHRALPGRRAAPARAGGHRHPAGERAAGGLGPRVRRRGHARQGVPGAPRAVSGRESRHRRQRIRP